MGVLLALMALVCWGIGDFLIEKSTRKFGDAAALFGISAFATIAIVPFIASDLMRFWTEGRVSLVLLLASAVALVASLLDFEALRIGKISVVEPIYALEILVTAALGSFLIHEFLSPLQIALVLLIVAGIFLVSVKSFHHFKGVRIEHGVTLAALAMIGMGAANFLVGVGARETSPLLIYWFLSATITAVLGAYLMLTGAWKPAWREVKKAPLLLLGVSLFDNGAWVAFAYSTLFIPIAVATSISESYIALAALLGIVYNREKLRSHQLVGLVAVLFGAAALSFATGG